MPNHNISILLPSVRPEAVKQTIREFAETNPGFDYEIVVVSPFEVQGENVIWVEEREPLGSVSATFMAYVHSRGKYVIYFSDDVTPGQNCLTEMYNFMEQHPAPFIGAFKMMDSTREIGPFGAYDKLYACYGCLSRETISKLDGFFDTQFLFSWADIDISLRCWEIGGKVEICHTAVVYPHQIHDDVYKNHREKYWNSDVNQFFDIWHEKLGKDLPRFDGAVNKRLIKIKK